MEFEGDINRAKKKPEAHVSEASGYYLAEREGFEPSIRCRIHTFQACAFSHSATSPLQAAYTKGKREASQ